MKFHSTKTSMAKKICFFILLLFPICSWSQEIPEKPTPARFVNDFARLLSDVEVATLETKLKNYQDSTSNQVVIVTTSSLNNYDIESYSYAIAKNWGIGQKEKNNGILITVAPNERKMRIEVGYGLEGAIPDAVCKHIIREKMRPLFKNNLYFEGLDSATSNLIKYASGEYKAEDIKEKQPKYVWWVVFIVIIMLISFISKFSRTKNSALGRDLDFWTILALMSMNNRGSTRGGDRNSGGWDFGGGSFGGGGASGDW